MCNAFSCAASASASAAVPVLRAAPAIIAAGTAVAAAAAPGMLHARTEITAHLSLPGWLPLWGLIFCRLILGRLVGAVFGMYCFRLASLRMFQLRGMRDHSLRLGLRLLGFFFGVRLPGILLFFRFSGILFGVGEACLVRLFLRGEILPLRVTRGFLRLCFGNLFGEGSGFVFAQVRRSMIFLRWFRAMQLFGQVRSRHVVGWRHVNCRVRFVRLVLARLRFLVMPDRRDSSFRVLVGRMFVGLPL